MMQEKYLQIHVTSPSCISLNKLNHIQYTNGRLLKSQMLGQVLGNIVPLGSIS